VNDVIITQMYGTRWHKICWLHTRRKEKKQFASDAENIERDVGW